MSLSLILIATSTPATTAEITIVTYKTKWNALVPAAVGVGVGVGVGAGLSVGVGVGVGAGLDVGVGVGVALGFSGVTANA